MAERIDIVVSEKGSVTVKRNIESIGRSSSNAVGEVNILTTALGGLAAAFGVREAQQLLDTYANMTNRLRTLTDDANELYVVQERLRKISNESRTDLADNVALYARFRNATKDLGTSQEELLKLTSQLSKAAVVSGASTQESSAALFQLSQGMASGTLRGQELNSILEQLPIVADIIAKELGVTRGELRKMGEEGKITSKVILKAFRNAGEDLIDGPFARTIPTIGQSLIVLKNEFISFFGKLDESLGITDKFSSIILLIAENMDTVGRVVQAAAGILLRAFALRALKAAIAGIRALGVAVATNPIGAFITLVSTLVGLLTAFKDRIRLASDSVATLEDFFVSLGRVVKPVIEGLIDNINALINGFLSDLGEAVGKTDLEFKDLLVLVGIVIDSVVKGARLVARVVPAILRTALFGFIGFIEKAANKYFEVQAELINRFLPEQFEIEPRRVGNAGLELAKEEIQTIVTEFNKATSGELGPVASLIEQALEGVDKIAAERIAKEKEIAAARAAAEKNLGSTGKDRTPRGGNEKALRDAERQRLRELKQLRQLRDQLDSVGAARRKLSETVAFLNDQQAKGNVTREEANDLTLRQTKVLADALNPLKAQIDAYQEEIELLQLDKDARAEFLALKEAENNARALGRDLTKEEIDLVKQSVARISELSTTTKQLAEERAPLTLAEGYRNALKEIAFEAQNAGDILQKALVGAFNNIENALVNFLTTGKFEFKKFVESILKDAARIAVRSVLGNLLGGALGGGAAAALPGFQYGGSFTVGGQGGPDSKMVAFRATPGEKVIVVPPNQQEATPAREGAPATVNVVNVTDPEQVISAMGSKKGVQTIVNVIASRRRQIQRALSGS